MEGKNNLLTNILLGLCTLLLISCSGGLNLQTAWTRVVKPGVRNAKPRTEFVFVIEKKSGDEVIVNEVDILGFNGYDYHFTNHVLMDSSLNKTFSSTQGLTIFSIYLSSGSEKSKSISTETELAATIRLSAGKNQKTIKVVNFEDRGIKRLR